LGVHVIERGEPGFVEQWEPYRDQSYNISSKESLVALWQYMDSNSMDTLFTRTSIIIVPGFQFRVMSYLINNFHQPKSTLLLLISAIVGDKWRDMYQFALDNNFRFLSYGDSSILSNVLLYSHNKY
jgi:S-adenosylmethionine:tRNA ribosyltransferase-isomerase